MSRAEQFVGKDAPVRLYATPTKRVIDGQARAWPGFTVAWRENGKRVRKWFSDEAKARAHAEGLAEKIAQGRIEELNITPEDVATWKRCRQVAAEFRSTPERALAEWADAKRELGSCAVSLCEPAREYRRRHNQTSTRPIGDIVQDLLAVKARLSRSPDYLRHLAQQLGRFAAAFECPLHLVHADDVERWLAGFESGPRTRRNYLGAVAELVRFAQERRDLPADWDELGRVHLPEMVPGKIQPYSPEDLARVLAHAEAEAPAWLPYLPIRAFSGIRYMEMHRLTPACFNLRGRWVALDAPITKTHTRRLVPISPNLAAWLRRYRPRVGEIAPYAERTLGPRLVELIRAAEVEPRRNGLRDSFASYRMALLGDAAKVAQECGHSPRMLAQSYREIRLPDGRMITAGLARRWFGICPDSVRTRAVHVNFGPK